MFASSCNTTPSSSLRSQPVAIASMASPTTPLSVGHNSPSQAFPFHSSLLRGRSCGPSAFVTDEDLFGDDDVEYLSEPPLPPRPAEVWLAQPLLPPVTAPLGGKSKSRRRSSGTKQERRLSKTKASG